jgi:hypothetical protein
MTLSAGFRENMARVVEEAVVGIPREYAMACRGTAVGSRRYLARLHHDMNDHHRIGKRLATYATALSAIFVRRDCTHLSKNLAAEYQKLWFQKYRRTHTELLSYIFRVLLWLAKLLAWLFATF